MVALERKHNIGFFAITVYQIRAQNVKRTQTNLIKAESATRIGMRRINRLAELFSRCYFLLMEDLRNLDILQVAIR